MYRRLKSVGLYLDAFSFGTLVCLSFNLTLRLRELLHHNSTPLHLRILGWAKVLAATAIMLSKSSVAIAVWSLGLTIKRVGLAFTWARFQPLGLPRRSNIPLLLQRRTQPHGYRYAGLVHPASFCYS